MHLNAILVRRESNYIHCVWPKPSLLFFATYYTKQPFLKSRMKKNGMDPVALDEMFIDTHSIRQ